MQAIVLKKHGHPEQAFQIEERDVPSPGEGEVLIKVAAFGLNFADVMARKGLYRDAPPAPCVLGYEVTGVIAETGAGVKDLKTGQRVVAFTRFGGYAEYALTDQRAVAPLSDQIEDDHALALATQYCTAWYCAHEAGNIRKGDHVLIHSAAGGVGTALVQLAKRTGCTVYGTASSAQKLDYLKEQGVDYPINYSQVDFREEIKKLRGSLGVDVVFDAVGGKIFKQSKQVLAFGGRIVTYGASSRAGKSKGILPTLRLVWDFGFFHPVFLIMKSQGIIGVNMLRIADHKPELLQHCLNKVVDLAENGEIHPQVGGVFEASDIAKAHALLESRQSIGKIVMRW